ncbi:hypothetical protein [Phnomibacter ginsenosidimutans]|uniref:RiboL-PSP-HEPN domain-containing protein n=1 Tax=Phnomibacter ginsenosidimutans TaxID=2676868 RepID=A0A6I6H181_9BACT|nr:hypothetical protein [Phnomibacter ginsenosidimutans]QGW28411.1 hypothetical protein GLV81_10160 [Phnomibacter ginsenosidimutans]
MKFPVPDGDHYDPSVVYVHQASHTRGVLINQIILLERLIDSYISKYFCNTQDKATELMDMILATRRMTFDGKADVFRTILDKLYPEKKKENSTIAKDLKFIIEERNMLAHYFLDVSPDILNSFSETNSAFTLLKIEKTRTREVFDFKRIIKIGDTTVHYINAINEMLQQDLVGFGQK